MSNSNNITPSVDLASQERWKKKEDVSPAGLIALFEDVFQSWKESLAFKMFIATIINFTERGLLDLELTTINRALGLGSSSELTVCQKQELPNDAIGRRITALTCRFNCRVRSILYSCWLRPCPKPQKDVERWVKEELEENGLMEKIEEKKRFRKRVVFKPIPYITDPLRSRALDLKSQVDQFKRQYPEKFKILSYEVNIGFETMTSYPV